MHSCNDFNELKEGIKLNGLILHELFDHKII